MIICIVLFLLLAALMLIGGRTEKEALKAAGKRLKVPHVIGGTGLFIALKLEALGKKGRASGSNPLLKTAEDLKIEKANRYGSAYLILLLGSLIGAILGGAALKNREVKRIQRPDFGEEKTVNLSALQAGQEADVRVSVSGRALSEEVLLQRFDEVFEASKSAWLGQNPDAEHVTKRLELTDESAEGICFRFQSRDPEILTGRGSIMAESIPPEGLRTVLTVTLSYGETEKAYDWPLTILPDGSAGGNQSLQAALAEADAKDPASPYLELPETVGGEAVTFQKNAVSPLTVLLFAVIGAVLLFLLPKEQEKQALKKRESELKLSYAGMVMKLSMLIRAGLSIRMAWYRVVQRYRDDLENGRCKRTYVYEEMQRTANELKTGATEGEAYVRFGRRCGLHRYLKFGNLLSENLKQGISGLDRTLHAELAEALEERKNLSLKKGEEAGTKLLLPMMVMLGIVIVTLVVPAFMAF